MSSSPGLRLVVDVSRQAAELRRDGEVVWSAPVSTSRHGLGEEEGSLKTPRGLHRVAEKIGAGMASGTRFVSRRPTGEVWTPELPPAEDDWVLTRILWLEGMEPRNANSKARYIYLHGTNREDRIGAPASIGCVRFRNADVAALFERVEIGTPVEIVE